MKQTLQATRDNTDIRVCAASDACQTSPCKLHPADTTDDRVFHTHIQVRPALPHRIICLLVSQGQRRACRQPRLMSLSMLMPLMDSRQMPAKSRVLEQSRRRIHCSIMSQISRNNWTEDQYGGGFDRCACKVAQRQQPLVSKRLWLNPRMVSTAL
ncbi:uncharacterized protein CLUP02_11501 [Colletotrichum lupini]|uniref:Uncharacterized protein n=1 Tax=Colletotrichum lupini TaxID=145971 RepID=A0A9Q8WKC6_9PEZI|nr:uncharacterized protein CLUP02_11501 [Colletotrichum lupini]UQC86002.1 hypothetical protein CLUP02_11501 [Colletotrichum lupini]